jgi:outer membrane receptor protein involved in Fe transport
VPGLRADLHSEFGVSVSPRLGLLYELARPLRLRASAGRGFRAPSLTELYMPDLLVSSTIFFVSNKALEPEYIWSFDGGFILMPLKNLMFQGDGFYNRMSGFIMPRYTSMDMAGVRVGFKNSDRAVSMGFDSELSWQPLRGVLGFANYTYTYSEDRDSKGELDYQPAHRANAGLTFHLKANKFAIDAGVTEAFVGERSYQDWETWKGDLGDFSSMRPQRIFLDPYWRTDLTFKVTYNNRLWAGLSVQNLTDAEFEEMGGFAAPARFVTLKVGGRI